MSPAIAPRRSTAASTAAADADRRLLQARLRASVGLDPAGAGLGDRAERALELARSTGAPVGAALESTASAASDLDEVRRAVHVATAQARLVVRGLVALPLALVPAMDGLLGVPLVGFYLHGPGRIVGALALGLMVLGAATARWMIRSVTAGRRPTGAADDEVADLLAAALRAGLPPAGALRAVGRVRPDLATPLASAALAIEHGLPAPDHPAIGDAVAVLAMGGRLGASVTSALHQLARRQRADRLAEVRARAEQLTGRLAIPSVLLFLPATVLLVGAPVVAVGLATG